MEKQVIKVIVQPKIESSVIIHSISRCYKLVCFSFVGRTQK